MVCQFLLYNKVNQLYIYIYPHIPSLLRLPPTLPIPPLQVVTKHRADLPVLCGCFPLAIYLTFGSVYMSMPLSYFVPTYPSPFPYPQVHSLENGLNQHLLSSNCVLGIVLPNFTYNVQFILSNKLVKQPLLFLIQQANLGTRSEVK